MQLKKNLRYQLLLGAILSCFLMGFSCDKPVEPVEPKDYPVYITDVNRSVLFTYYPKTLQIDSVAIPWRAEEGITVSADGSRLYLATNSNVTVIDSKSHSLIAELPYRPHTPVAVSPDNQLVAITGDDLTILRTSDYSVVFSDTDKTENGCFSADGKRFYCAAGWSTNTVGVVYKVDLSDSLFAVDRLPIADGGVIHVVPSFDETKLFLYLNVPGTYAFEVYDVMLDSIIFREFLVPGAGEIAVMLDGRYVVYTNPGVSGTGPPSTGTFKIFDVVANEILAEVSAYDYVDSLPALIPPYTMAVSPEGRWLVLLGGIQLAQQAIYLYDFERQELVDYKYLGRNIVLTNPTVQIIK